MQDLTSGVQAFDIFELISKNQFPDNPKSKQEILDKIVLSPTIFFEQKTLDPKYGYLNPLEYAILHGNIEFIDLFLTHKDSLNFELLNKELLENLYDDNLEKFLNIILSLSRHSKLFHDYLVEKILNNSQILDYKLRGGLPFINILLRENFSDEQLISIMQKYPESFVKTDCARGFVFDLVREKKDNLLEYVLQNYEFDQEGNACVAEGSSQKLKLINLLKLKNSFGLSFFKLACVESNLKIINLAVENLDSEQFFELVKPKTDEKFKTFLHQVFDQGNIGIIEAIFDKLNSEQLFELLKTKSSKDDGEKSLLHLFIKKNERHLIKYLSEKLDSIQLFELLKLQTCKTQGNLNSFHVLFYLGNCDLLKDICQNLNSEQLLILLSNKCSESYFRYTPIHFAFKNNHKGLFEVLCENLSREQLLKLLNEKSSLFAQNKTPLQLLFEDDEGEIGSIVLAKLYSDIVIEENSIKDADSKDLDLETIVILSKYSPEVKAYLAKKINEDPEILNFKDARGYRLLLCLIDAGFDDEFLKSIIQKYPEEILKCDEATSLNFLVYCIEKNKTSLLECIVSDHPDILFKPNRLYNKSHSINDAIYSDISIEPVIKYCHVKNLELISEHSGNDSLFNSLFAGLTTNKIDDESSTNNFNLIYKIFFGVSQDLSKEQIENFKLFIPYYFFIQLAIGNYSVASSEIYTGKIFQKILYQTTDIDEDYVQKFQEFFWELNQEKNGLRIKIGNTTYLIYNAQLSDHAMFYIFLINEDNKIFAVEYHNDHVDVDERYVDEENKIIHGVTRFELSEPVEYDAEKIEDFLKTTAYKAYDSVIDKDIFSKLVFNGQKLSDCRREHFLPIKDSKRGNCTYKNFKLLSKYLFNLKYPELAYSVVITQDSQSHCELTDDQSEKQKLTQISQLEHQVDNFKLLKHEMIITALKKLAEICKKFEEKADDPLLGYLIKISRNLFKEVELKTEEKIARKTPIASLKASLYRAVKIHDIAKSIQV